MNKKELTITGRNASVDFVGHAKHVPAKVDTGADSSSVWATNIRVDEHGVLRFTLFDEGSKWYTGEVIERPHYNVAMVRSASGHEQIRYRVEFTMRVEGRRIRAVFNLSDRSRNKFPVLIGRRSLSGKFIVDVSKARYRESGKVFEMENGLLNRELTKDPYEFYRKYYGKDIQ
ncbi:MAG: ribosomal protein modification protein RimK [Candidatus Saccharibacteria bacterium]|nr:ribosomal protein modification protein RimK [Candidatus Saccharibacteria bacterium]